MRTVAVVLAAGSGQRFGGGLPKQLRTLAGRTLIEHSVSAFHEASGIDAILVVTSPELIGRVGRLVRDGRFGKVSAVIEGGVTRTGSTRRAIAALGEDDCDVLFHDAARPLIDQQTIAACVDALATDRAIGVTVPSSDTIVEAVDGMVTRMPIRDLLLRCQSAWQRAQHQDHLPDRPRCRRATAQNLTLSARPSRVPAQPGRCDVQRHLTRSSPHRAGSLAAFSGRRGTGAMPG